MLLGDTGESLTAAQRIPRHQLPANRGTRGCGRPALGVHLPVVGGGGCEGQGPPTLGAIAASQPGVISAGPRWQLRHVTRYLPRATAAPRPLPPGIAPGDPGRGLGSCSGGVCVCVGGPGHRPDLLPSASRAAQRGSVCVGWPLPRGWIPSPNKGGSELGMGGLGGSGAGPACPNASIGHLRVPGWEPARSPPSRCMSRTPVRGSPGHRRQHTAQRRRRGIGRDPRVPSVRPPPHLGAPARRRGDAGPTFASSPRCFPFGVEKQLPGEPGPSGSVPCSPPAWGAGSGGQTPGWIGMGSPRRGSPRGSPPALAGSWWHRWVLAPQPKISSGSCGGCRCLCLGGG